MAVEAFGVGGRRWRRGVGRHVIVLRGNAGMNGVLGLSCSICLVGRDRTARVASTRPSRVPGERLPAKFMAVPVPMRRFGRHMGTTARVHCGPMSARHSAGSVQQWTLSESANINIGTAHRIMMRNTYHRSSKPACVSMAGGTYVSLVGGRGVVAVWRRLT